jgi:hypothetical protein
MKPVFYPCQAGDRFAIVRPLAKHALSAELNEKKEGLDGMFETPHNLASSLMNTTLLSKQYQRVL